MSNDIELIWSKSLIIKNDLIICCLCCLVVISIVTTAKIQVSSDWNPFTCILIQWCVFSCGNFFVYFEGILNSNAPCQIKWLLKLSQIAEVTEVPSFSEEAQSFLQGIIDGFSMDDALEVKNIEKVTNHDVKAVEYFLKQKCQSQPEIAKVEVFLISFFRYWNNLFFFL